ncbi:MAG: MaoC/PaaZ C-terminal domain-containing protein [Desulfobacterales bacterium]|nr:MaoC/PaaZ C-terminal domain-containing protein [Desulfobacterales bacterium]
MSEPNFRQLHGYYLEDITVGMSAVYSRVLTEERVKLFADVSGDINPLHLNETFASQTRFKKRIVHGGKRGLMDAVE